MTLLYAQPYDSSIEGFYFRDIEEYDKTVVTIRNSFGDPVEEFEIQFIGGGQMDCELAQAVGLNQANINTFLAWTEEWEDEQKIRFIVAVGECGYSFDENTDPDEFDVDIYEEESLKDLAIHFVQEELFCKVPEAIQYYIDYDAIARDLSVDYSEIIIAGQRLIYRCA